MNRHPLLWRIIFRITGYGRLVVNRLHAEALRENAARAHVHSWPLMTGICRCGHVHPSLGPPTYGDVELRVAAYYGIDPRVVDTLSALHEATLDALPTKDVNPKEER